jgi:acyl-CoA reductase-like NAD-dependent aldehyde dehydrogenase
MSNNRTYCWPQCMSRSTSPPSQIPFGGVKASGYGKFGGPAALDEFTELRWITISGGKGEYPI